MIDKHLTSEQMDALLMEPGAGDRSQHLADCTLCAEEFESLQSVMNDLRTGAIASAEREYRVAALPAISHPRPRVMWALAIAAAIVCVCSSIGLRRAAVPLAAVNAPQQQVQAAVSDEQMMSNVQEDLSASVPQAMLPLAATNISDGGGSTASTYAPPQSSKENE